METTQAASRGLVWPGQRRTINYWDHTEAGLGPSAGCLHRTRLFGAGKSVSDVNGTASFFCRGGIPGWGGGLDEEEADWTQTGRWAAQERGYHLSGCRQTGRLSSHGLPSLHSGQHCPACPTSQQSLWRGRGGRFWAQKECELQNVTKSIL